MTTLDDFCQSEKITEIDFIQIDTQGAEIQVIEGAANILKQSTLALKVEVEFTKIYENQPLFSDVDLSLRNQNFSFFDFGMLYRDYRRRGPLISQEHSGQLIWTDAFYFRDLIEESNDIEFVDIPKKLLNPRQREAGTGSLSYSFTSSRWALSFSKSMMNRLRGEDDQ